MSTRGAHLRRPERPPTADDWGGARVTRLRAEFTQLLPAPCGAGCGRVVTANDQWVIGHKKSRILHPELMWDRRNMRIECRPCSDRSGTAAIIEKARAEGATAERARMSSDTLDFFGGGQRSEPPPLPNSLSENRTSVLEVPERLQWSPDLLRSYPWLARFAEVPEDASPPLAMSPPHPDAVGSYGEQVVDWMRTSLGIEARWWQALAITRQLEHREDGSLTYGEIVESAPRRAGKSVRIRGVALWRLTFGPELFGERQEIVHTGSDLAVCRKVQKDAWRWAEAQDLTVTRGNGKEAIETAAQDTWLVRAQAACYGWDTTLGLVDEGWDVHPGTVSEGLEPSLLERASPQLHLTSTAHRRATSLMRGRLQTALATDDATILLLLWGARPQDDPGDPQTWRKASPYWTEARRVMIEKKHKAAVAGEADPESDDPDPMASFTSQYLNLWELSTGRRAPTGDPVLTVAEFGSVQTERPSGAPSAVAIESWFAEGVSVAAAWWTSEGVVASVSRHPTLAAAVTAASAWQHGGPLLVGKSLTDDPALADRWVDARTDSSRSVAQRLRRLFDDGAFRHDGSIELREQVEAIRMAEGADGPRVTSRAPGDAVRAAVWAVEAARAAADEVTVF